MFGRRVFIVLLCVLGLAAAPAPLAWSQVSGPLIGPQAPAVETEPPGDEESREDGLASSVQLALLLAVLAMIGGIAWFIVRDSSRSTSADRPRPAALPEREEGERRPRKGDRAKRRAKGKQARQQRKRNRPR